MARPRVEVVHVGSACRDVVARGPARLAARRRRHVRLADDGPARAADRGDRRRRRDGGRPRSELDMLRDAGVDLLLVPLPEGPIFHNVETPAGRVQTCVQTGVPLPIPDIPEAVARGAGLVAGAGRGRGRRRLGGASSRPTRIWRSRGRASCATSAAGERVDAAGRREPSAILRRADLVGVSHHDVRAATPRSPSSDEHAPPGRRPAGHPGRRGRPADPPRRRRSDRDAALPARPRPSGEVDPTGAGDTFLAALQASVLRPAVAGRRRARVDRRTCASRRPPGRSSSKGSGLDGVPDRAAVLVRRARERIRRAVLPTEVSQVGAVDASWRPRGRAPTAQPRGAGPVEPRTSSRTGA